MIRSISFSLAFWGFALLPVFAQTGFNGNFVAVVDGMPCRLVTTTRHNEIKGTYDEGGFSLQVTGTTFGNKANGDLTDPSLNKVVANFEAILVDSNRIDLTFSVSGQKRSHTFVREGTAELSSTNKANIAPGTRDARLVGSWIYQVITSTKNTGLQTVFYLRINANGQYAEYSKSVGGGDLSYDSGQAEIQQKGLWYSNGNVFYIRPEGQETYTSAANYHFEKGNLITEDVSGQKIWERE